MSSNEATRCGLSPGRFLGDPRQWPRIYRLNRRDIKNPDLIFPGQSLAIPSGIGLESKVALGFDSRIDIRDPGAFDKVSLSGHQKPADSRLQFVTATLPTAPGTTAIDFFFAAPCAVDPSTHVSVFTSAGGSVAWEDVTFDTESGLDKLQGPAVAATTVPGPSSHPGAPGGPTGVTIPSNKSIANLTAHTGILPYASEMFGVYQPMIGWRSKRMVRRHSVGLAESQRSLLQAFAANYVGVVDATLSKTDCVADIKKIDIGHLSGTDLIRRQTSILMQSISDKLPKDVPPVGEGRNVRRSAHARAVGVTTAAGTCELLRPAPKTPTAARHPATSRFRTAWVRGGSTDIPARGQPYLRRRKIATPSAALESGQIRARARD